MSNLVSVDLEVDPSTAKLFAFAAVRGDDGASLTIRRGVDAAALDRLDAFFCAPAQHIIGHNILRHDLPHLVAQRAGLARLGAAPIDTLWLNPVAFPRNPYHHLVKHYQDGRLLAGHVNDPQADARLVFDVLGDQITAFEGLQRAQPDLLTAYHYLTTRAGAVGGFDAVFTYIRRWPKPSAEAALATIRRVLAGKVCAQRLEQTLGRLQDARLGWPMAYALSWISVAGGESVMPPWVRAQFREAGAIVRYLRDSDCGDPKCAWCAAQNNPKAALHRWFGFDAFRPQPADEAGRPLQERIVAEAMAGKSVLGILPTGTGKSICYQVPALSRFDKTGALTVVISPLVALMADQVQGLARAGISAAVTVNGMLSLPERNDAMEKVRMGDAAILLISPEQLRSKSIRAVLAQREVGLWVLDEAHCISKWGHDFRPDYRYVSRFIKEFSGDSITPILCLTATAKPDVIRDMRDHFQSRLGVDLLLLDGGAKRTNLSFEVLPTTKASKLSDILNAIEARLPPEGASGAVIYCATRRTTELVADFLARQGLSADFFHAGLTPERKAEVQEAFRTGALRVIAATNAFGMGIDKPDIRLVVHGDIPGSLENYLQEAGRAGRDRAPAACVLLYASEDVERQFNLTARSRLARHEIGAILKALRRLEARQRMGEVVATSGEIVREEQEREFQRDSTTEDTRVKTALSWLEEAKLAVREENRVQVFPSSLRIRSMDEAAQILAKAGITGVRQTQLKDVMRHMMNAPPDQGISTDTLAGAAGMGPSALQKALSDLEALGIASNDTVMTVYVHLGGDDASQKRLERAGRLERDLIALMQEAAPDADENTALPLGLIETAQTLRNAGHAQLRPDIVEGMLRSMAHDGRDLEGGRGNVVLRKLSQGTLSVRLTRSWAAIAATADLRGQAAQVLLRHLIGKAVKGARGKDIQVETTMGALQDALSSDAFVREGAKDLPRLMQRALLWMHEQGVLTLGRGMTVFRPAMTVHLPPKAGLFTQAHFAPLEDHYTEQTIQTHVMAAYAETGLKDPARAQVLANDYFVLERDEFLRRWLPGRGAEVRRQTMPASWKMIVDALANPVQQSIVQDDREHTNVLVLAGPGSGKTRVLVHRIAYLVRIRRQDPKGILVLAYNRHAAAEIRARLRVLIGEDALGVTVMTCHALAMRLVGASFAGDGPRDFDGVVREAAILLNAAHLPRAEAEALRDTLIQGYRWLLVDEYQDIGPEEYALIAAVAGRSQADPDLRISLMAVGDDDQNIYAFAGASVEFIRMFEADYMAKPVYLTENYRSSAHIIAASNAIIAPAPQRMKVGHDITVNTARAKENAGGPLAQLDPVAQGRVTLLDAGAGDVAQAIAALDELFRLSTLDPDWDWRRCAIIAREWRRLDPVRAYAEHLGLKVDLASDTAPPIWRLREMQAFVRGVLADRGKLLSVADLVEILNKIPPSPWRDVIGEGIGAFALELVEKTAPAPDVVEWFGAWARDARGEPRGLRLLTAHRAKGLEFDHVAILNGGWDRPSRGEDAAAPRRLFYVAATRAKSSLTVLTDGAHPFLAPNLPPVLTRKVQQDSAILPHARLRYVSPRLEDMFLSFAGHLKEGDPSLAAVATAQVGQPVKLVQRGKSWAICTADGTLLARFANNFAPPEGAVFLRGQITAILNWRSKDSGEDYRHLNKRDEWEVILPELVFEMP